MHRVAQDIIRVTTTGSAGSATGNSTSEKLRGLLLDFYVDYNASAPGTTDVTITNDDDGDTIVTITDNATDGRYPVSIQAKDKTGADITGVYDYYALNNPIKVAVAGADALTDCVVVKVRYLAMA